MNCSAPFFTREREKYMYARVLCPSARSISAHFRHNHLILLTIVQCILQTAKSKHNSLVPVLRTFLRISFVTKIRNVASGPLFPSSPQLIDCKYDIFQTRTSRKIQLFCSLFLVRLITVHCFVFFRLRNSRSSYFFTRWFSGRVVAVVLAVGCCVRQATISNNH